MGISHKPTTRVISCRVDNDTYARLDLRARKKGVKLGAYIKDFLERDLYRTRGDSNE